MILRSCVASKGRAAGESRGPGVALIIGITGQDGSYLAELLLAKGYQVHGIKRRSSSFNTERVDHLVHEPGDPSSRFHLHYGDLADAASLTRILSEIRPTEIYNLGAQSHVGVSFQSPEYTADVDALGALRVLEAVRLLDLPARVYQASSSEMFGNATETPQTEATPFRPCSPYGAAKLCAYWHGVTYRDAYGMHVSNGILFNHESPRRGETFVTRKITRAVARIRLGLQRTLYLGNLDARRDWGHARDYVEAMWRMVQRTEPGDYVIATGCSRSVRDFVTLAFDCAGTHIEWTGEGALQRAVDRDTGAVVVAVDPRYFRPTDIRELVGDASKARQGLGWRPAYGFSDMVAEMVANDLGLAQRERLCVDNGYAPERAHAG